MDEPKKPLALLVAEQQRTAYDTYARLLTEAFNHYRESLDAAFILATTKIAEAVKDEE